MPDDSLDEEPMGSEEKEQIWNNYLITERMSFLDSCRVEIGYEYEVNRQEWDYLFERDWILMEERLKCGIGVSNRIKKIMGLDFFKKTEIVMDDIESAIENIEVYHTEGGNDLRIYTYEDFIMLSNQGIFRDDVFIIDPQRKWKKKVKEKLIEYGYSSIEIINIAGGIYFVVEG